MGISVISTMTDEHILDAGNGSTSEKSNASTFGPKAEFWAFQIISLLSLVIFGAMAGLSAATFIINEIIWGSMVMCFIVLVSVFALYLWFKQFRVNYAKLKSYEVISEEDKWHKI